MARTCSARGSRGIRSASAALLLLVCASARAQTTGIIVGTVTDAATGRPVGGSLVVATSPALQGEQTAVTDSLGRYTLSLLPPGRYKVAAHVDGYQPEERGGLLLRIDYTLRANLAMTPSVVRLEEQVVRTALAPVINVGSAEAGAVISREYLATVPTTRDYEGTMIVAPTAIRDGGGIAFAGATSPENNYILDGMRVGDPSANYLGVNLPTNFVDQIDVKVGGFMPEYGYASGAIVNAVTRSGSNEFHGSLWGNLTPGLLSPPGEVVGRNGEAVASYLTPYKGSYDTDFGLEVGGPIVKDRLWFYAGFAPRLQYTARTGYYRTRVASAANPLVAERDAYNLFVMETLPGTEFVYGAGTSTYFGVAKLTWLVGEDHNLFASFTTQPGSDAGRYGVNGSSPALTRRLDYNTTTAVVGYGGKFLDKHLIVEANVGWYSSPYRTVPVTVDGVATLQTPRIAWQTMQPLENFDPAVASACPYGSRQAAIGNAPGCYVQGYGTGGAGGIEDSTTSRAAGTASVTALLSLLGQHRLKGGVQVDYSDYAGSYSISGGSSWWAWGRFLGPESPFTGGSFDEFQMTAYGSVDPASLVTGPGGPVHSSWCTSIENGVCVNPGGKIATQPGVQASRAHNWANAYYVQDSWTIANALTLGFGIRLETQKMTNATPGSPAWTPQLEVTDMWAPRVQAVWDFTGQGRGKIQANWGRYYESIPLLMSFRSFATATSVYGSHELSSCDAAMIPGPTSTGNPAARCPNVYGLDAGQGPGPNTVSLDGTGFSETGAFSPVAPGLKGQYTEQFGGGIQYEVLQDLSVGIDYVGRRLGTVVEDMSSDDGLNYFIANPGVSTPWTPTTGPYTGVTFNPQMVTAVDPSSGASYTARFPKPTRSYDAVSATLTKAFSKRWVALASYTWSSLRGNFPGLLRAGQFAPNVLSEFDLVSLLGNRTGPLGADRTHQVKIAGSYTLSLDEQWSLVPGMQLVALSGIPVSATGFHPLYGSGESFVLPRGMAGNLPWVVNLDLSVQAIWNLAGPYRLSFTVSVFNVLGGSEPTAVDERYTLATVTPMQGSTCGAKNSISQPDPLAALQANCPDLAYLRTTDNQPAVPNLNYGRPTGFQVPVSARFGVALTF